MNFYSNYLQNRDYRIASLRSAVRYSRYAQSLTCGSFQLEQDFFYSRWCSLSLDKIDHDGCDPAIDAKEVTLSQAHT